ncbi:hypothetical protein ACFOEE_01530 [Pseudoalteromonas fenneropenaei]|uniref:Uncharacterized protein n=1 Tax=Pseudoalteromonas fenneropenaei TaxID=1737459 RepID=A0ABV7CF34_9GAMM
MMKSTYKTHLTNIVFPIQFIAINKLKVVIKDSIGFKNIEFNQAKEARSFAKHLQHEMVSCR